MTPNDELAQALDVLRERRQETVYKVDNPHLNIRDVLKDLDTLRYEDAAYIAALEAENTQLKGDLQAEIDLREMVVAFVNDWLDSVGVPREVNGYKLLPYGVLRRAYEALHASDPGRQVEPGENGVT